MEIKLLVKLSVSSMDTHKSCPKKYHYRYIEKPDVPKVKHSFTELGSCGHRMLELFHETILKEPVDERDYSLLMKRCFVDAVKEFDLHLLQQDTWMPQGDMPGMQALKIMMQDYLDRIRVSGVPDVIGVELAYNFKLDDETVIRGFIDRVDRVSPGVYHVVDYKTSKNPKYLKEFQLLVYAEALRREFGDVEVVHGSYMMLKHGCEMKDYTFDLSSMAKCEANLHKINAGIRNDKTWIKKPSILCRWCDYRAICQDAWSE